MAISQDAQPKGRYNNYFVTEKDLAYAPPYFRDVPETPNEVKCETSGHWPEWLNGTFMRVGAGRYTIPLSEDGSKPNAVLQHFFDGLGMLHKFRMSGGQVYYSSRHTAEGVVRKAKREGRLSVTMFGLNANTPLKDAQDPCSALLGAQQSLYVPSGFVGPDEVNVNVVPRRGMHLPPDENPYSRGSAAKNPQTEEVLVHTDFNMLQVCDAKTLEPKRMLTYAEIDSRLRGNGICSHPPKDRKRGLTFNYIINPETQVMSVFSLNIGNNPASVEWVTPLPCKPCYIHSLAMTDKYVVFIRNPISMDTSDMTKPLMEMLQYEANTPTQFFVLDKLTGKHISTYEQDDGFMFFHSVNAYDYQEGDPATGGGRTNVHVDLCSYKPDYIPYREYNLSNVVDPAGPYQDGTLTRYELAAVDVDDDDDDEDDAHPAIRRRRRPSRRVATVVRSIPDMASELPRIAKSASMDPDYRYVYCTAGNGGASPGTGVPIGRLGGGRGSGVQQTEAAFFGSLAKADWRTGTYLRWQPGPDGESCPCEPVFVQRPPTETEGGEVEEDDGVVLTIVVDRMGTHSILVALDGKTFREVARAELPQVYGLGPHGSFIEGEFGA